MQTYVFDFLSPDERLRHATQYTNGEVILCNSNVELLNNLAAYNTDQSAAIFQILAHGFPNGFGLSNRQDSISWEDLVQTINLCRTNYYLRLNLIVPCYAHTIRPYLANSSIDVVWVNTAGLNGEFSLAFNSNDYDSFVEYIHEEVEGIVEPTFRELSQAHNYVIE